MLALNGIEGNAVSDIEIGSVWVHKQDEKISVEVTGLNNGSVKGLMRDNSDYIGSKSDFLYFFKTKLKYSESEIPKAVQILNEAVQIMAERGKSYDKSGGQAERSMPKIVAMFNALTGHELTPAQGWKFMACLKLARSEQGEHREDNYLDGAAYFALAGEEAGEDSK